MSKGKTMGKTALAIHGGGGVMTKFGPSDVSWVDVRLFMRTDRRRLTPERNQPGPLPVERLHVRCAQQHGMGNVRSHSSIRIYSLPFR